MLPKHLIAKTSPKPNPQNLVFWKDFRITVLKNSLFRIEQDLEKQFNDSATQTVWFRKTKTVDYSLKNENTYIKIKTSSCTLHLEDDFSKSYVLLSNKKVFLDNTANLKGTNRTLDGDFGSRNAATFEEIPLDIGVCSKNGVAVINDLQSLRLTQDGTLIEAYPQQIDCYIFAYGNNYREAIKALYDITGYPPLLPRYALGNWWSRYHAYNDKEYLTTITNFENRNIPFTVASIDMDWHYSFDLDEQKKITESNKNTAYYGGNVGWTGYSWNEKLFPNYKEFLKELKRRGYHITLNLHPSDGVRWFENQYKDFAKAMSIDSSTEQHIPFDITNEKFIKAYFEILHKPYEKDGVDFWWIDWQQGTTSAKTGLDPMWSLNHYHFLDNAKAHTPLILSRYCNIGAHRYPVGFSGDTYIVWESLDYLPYFTANASNVGFCWWSHDIGGHCCGFKDDELYLRYVQYGTFCTINRFQCTNWEVINKEPNLFMNGTGLIAEEFLRLRHKLIPYIYSANYRVHIDGIPLIEPLYYHEPEVECAYSYKNQYYFGEQLMVAPITKPIEKDGLVNMKVYFPKGKWTDIFTLDIYEGGKETEIARWLDYYPVFAKEGAIIVSSGDDTRKYSNPKKLVIDVYNGDGCFNLYEDKNGKNLAITHFNTINGNNSQKLIFSTDGNLDSIPKKRSCTINFKNIKDGNIKVLKNKELIPFKNNYENFASITISNIDYEATYEIIVTYKIDLDISVVKERALNILSRYEGSNTQKFIIWNNINKTTSIQEYINLINDYANALPQGLDSISQEVIDIYYSIENESVKKQHWNKLPKSLYILLLETL